jgi:hypothetical protein
LIFKKAKAVNDVRCHTAEPSMNFLGKDASKIINISARIKYTVLSLGIIHFYKTIFKVTTSLKVKLDEF